MIFKLKNKGGKVVEIKLEDITEIVPTIKNDLSIFYITIFQGNKCDSFYGYHNENLNDTFIELIKQFKNNRDRRNYGRKENEFNSKG